MTSTPTPKVSTANSFGVLSSMDVKSTDMDDRVPIVEVKTRDNGGSYSKKNQVDTLANEESDSEVEDVHNKTASFIASTRSKGTKASTSGSGVENKSLYTKWKESGDETHTMMMILILMN
ncbi:hypothetical protein Tco_0794868 [Tanacetum coccineum]